MEPRKLKLNISTSSPVDLVLVLILSVEVAYSPHVYKEYLLVYFRSSGGLVSLTCLLFAR